MTIVGIDLGTTNTVVAFCEPGDPEPRLFEVPQLVGAGQVAARPLLPSFLYAPLEGEAPDERWRLGPWIAGEHARGRGAEIAGRLVSSPKSWLGYAQVDRRAAVLPWRTSSEDDDDGPRVSPVAAQAALLGHVERVWRARFPDRPLAEQEVILTVPASFDPVARELTVEAARAAGFAVRLLEEPQAAFYDCMQRGDAAIARAIPADRDEGTVLVVDVGGGTSDFSLIRVRKSAAGFELDRVAVGRHLLLGGDNMDLALAHRCERGLVPEGERLDPRRFVALTAACRAAKERFLGAEPPAELPIAVAKSGARLVGGTLRTTLRRDEVEEIVVEGFFPRVAQDEPPRTARSALVAFGLPYERDGAVTRHLAAFLRRHAAESPPTAVLLNGGVFRAAALVERLLEVVRSWLGDVAWLEHRDPDTSVALGAAAYGLALAGKARRIGGGAAHGYYLGVASSEGARAVCVLPRGAEEERVYRLATPMELVLGRPVRFDLFTADDRDEPGAVVAVDARHERLAPLCTALRHESGGKQRIPVFLEAQLGAVGVLEVSCVEAPPGERRYALAFDLRAGGEESDGAVARLGKRLDEVRAAIEHVFSKSARKAAEPKEVKGLVRELERILGKRSQWDAPTSRALYDLVFRHHRGRKTTAEHERIFWMLTGFCLRPGRGAVGDDDRARALFALFDERLAHPLEPRSWQQYWIAWRRIAAGLDDAAQLRLRDVIDPFIAPDEKKLKKPKPFKNDAAWEMVELAAGLERAPAARRAELGGWLLERTWTDRDPRLWAAIGRLGARVPVYGSVHHVVGPATVERWLDHLLRERWETLPSAARAAVAMSRVTGDRARDVGERTREAVARRLLQLGVAEEERKPVEELVELDDRDRAAFFGDDLPVGLRVVSSG